MCPTCPFRADSPYRELAPALTKSALTEASRICHSTGTSAINRRTGRPSAFCRGARDIQLQVMANMRVIDAPTDDAWNAKRIEIGMKPTKIVKHFP